MIHKVNRPSFLRLVPKTKQSENDPGSSQGSGNFYEKYPSKEQESPEKKESRAEELSEEVSAEMVTAQIGMAEVVKEFLEEKKTEGAVSPGLSVRYTSDSQPAKGLLLNKKAE